MNKKPAEVMVKDEAFYLIIRLEAANLGIRAGKGGESWGVLMISNSIKFEKNSGKRLNEKEIERTQIY